MRQISDGSAAGPGVVRNLIGLGAALALVLWAGLGQHSAASDTAAPVIVATSAAVCPASAVVVDAQASPSSDASAQDCAPPATD